MRYQDEEVQDISWVEVNGCGGDDLVAIIRTGLTRAWKAWHWTGTGYEEITHFTTAPLGPRAFWGDFDSDGDADQAI